LGENSDITLLLAAATDGDRSANDALFDAVYRQLREIARAQRKRWSGNHTLDTSALINEAYLKLAGQSLSEFNNRGHFFATASRAMRQVLINYAERMASAKRGNTLLERLEAENVRYCRLFECRVFGGMTIAETAEALEVSPATVKRDWALVSAWVYRELGPR